MLVRGGKHTMPLMGQIAAEVHRRGAHPLMLVESDTAWKAYFQDKPEARLAENSKPFVELLGGVDFQTEDPNPRRNRLWISYPSALRRAPSDDVFIVKGISGWASNGSRPGTIGGGLSRPSRGNENRRQASEPPAVSRCHCGYERSP